MREHLDGVACTLREQQLAEPRARGRTRRVGLEQVDRVRRRELPERAAAGESLRVLQHEVLA